MGRLIDPSADLDGKLSAVRNPDGLWINSSMFREEALNFLRLGVYTSAPRESPDYNRYWQEQRNRCINGYSVGGAMITGEHYYYLNFCQIKLTEDPSNPKSRKIKSFPDFWDGDYNYFWAREIAKEGLLNSQPKENRVRILSLKDSEQILELTSLYDKLFLEVKIPSHTIIKNREGEDSIKHNLKGGYNLAVGKSRRKGYSLKNGAVGAKNYFTKLDSYTIYAAHEKKFLYPKGLFTMCRDNITFVNEHTGWTAPSDYLDRQDHVKSSYKETKNGVSLESGFMSEVQALTFKDNPDAARGKDAEDIFFEECGAFGTPGTLKNSYAATQDCVMDGTIKTGMITLFGTSGDMQGGTVDYADMYNRPEAFGLLPFEDIWNEENKSFGGFFHPINWNLPGFYDKEGNSDLETGRKVELNERRLLIQSGATSSELQKRLQEKPLNSDEAFSTVSINNFPVLELKRQLSKVKSLDLQSIKGTPVEMSIVNGEVKAKPILSGRPEAIVSLRSLPDSIEGTPVIYEYPIENPEKGLYKVGYDPVRQDEGSSLAAIIVYKSFHVGAYNHNTIVAEYIGRKTSTDDIDELALMIAEFYGTTVMYENEVPGTKNYFRRRKKLHLLAVQPDSVISKNIKTSKVARVYGCHMNKQLKDAGERYVKDWLNTVYDHDENDDVVTVIDKIHSIRLLEELINYSRDGNFDLVSSLFMCMMQIQEEALGKEYSKREENSVLKNLALGINKMYKK